jgi:hypothetical protein
LPASQGKSWGIERASGFGSRPVWTVKYNCRVKFWAASKILLTALLLFSSNLLFIEPAQANLYAFSSHTFTPCGNTGTTGPLQASCRSAYSTTWDDNDSYFTVTGGIQYWVVPATGNYTIEAGGAKGGNGNTGTGGAGARMTGTFSLTQGAKLRIIVGQSGTDGAWTNGGGGGGTFVQNNADLNTTGIFVIAGGGGGGGYYSNGTNVNAVTTNASQPGWKGNTASSLNNPASSGNGGFNFSKSGGGGGGFSGNGGSTSSTWCGTVGGVGGSSFSSGGSGATGSYAGGFGGGGSGDWCDNSGGGGGGGYSGGSGGYFYGSGGGGGSYNNGSSQTNLAASNNATGFVTITLTSTPDTTPPTFTSSSSFSAAENIATSATAATIRVSESATVTISSGADAARFNISRSETNTAIIKFNASPDFEAPADVGGNNVYEITLTATDSAANAGTQAITITVTDVVDTSGFNSLALAGSATTATYRTVIVITANITVASKVTFRVNGKILPGCKNKSTTGSSPNIVATCTWKPSIRGNVSLTAAATPTGAGISSSTSTPVSIMVDRRTGSRVA